MPASRFHKGPSRFSSKRRPYLVKATKGSPHAAPRPTKPWRSRGGRPAQKRGQPAPFSDISKFINKAVVTEVTEIFNPQNNFADFNIDARLKSNIIAKGYTLPTPIQDRAIPHILRGEDV